MLTIQTKAKCVECARVFNLMDEDDAGEWYYGHDCEVQTETGASPSTRKAGADEVIRQAQEGAQNGNLLHIE